MRPILISAIVLTVALSGSCRKDFLIVKPDGDLNTFNLATDKGIETLLVGAYSMLDGVSSVVGGWESASSNWVFGSIRGMEANFGSDSGDQGDKNGLQNFNETSTQSYLDIKWREVYEAISRCNSVIMVINQALTSGNIDQNAADLYLGQARALRGWYHFEAWRMWKMIPYIDEKADAKNVKNTEDIRSKIIDDLTAGTSLPDNMRAIGKFNGTVSKVLLAKALMQMNHDYSGALPLLLGAKAGSKPDGSPIGLAQTYGEIFDIVNRNGIESVYTVQYSVNDGSGGLNGGFGEVLNFPYKTGTPSSCCGFFQPTQEFVNSFRTSGGLPLLDNSYNLNPIKNDEGVAVSDTFIADTGPIDPRLDWSVGRRGIPYWDWGLHTGADWIRDQSFAGPYSPKKQVYKKSDTGIYTEVGSWTSGFTANGYRMIRFADVLLLIAECQIETSDLVGALANINAVRSRAANTSGWVKLPNGTNAANYQISTYPSFPDQDYARKALRMERKLELGQEGHRFFDLNRWNITVDELNRVLNYEKSMPWGQNLYGSATVRQENVMYPIPQRQIDLSSGNLVQNR
jgi:starch-binding outer membrane protein, SusD/RagB family